MLNILLYILKNNYVFLNLSQLVFSHGPFSFRKIAHIRLIYLYILGVLIIEPRTGCMLGKHSTPKPHPSHLLVLTFVFRQGFTKFPKLALNLVLSCHCVSSH